jgi:membrane-associated protease RseP (regulator of RpoE activity)
MKHFRSALLVAVIALTGCPAVYPELGTRTRTIPAGVQLDPPPPPELRWVRFLSGRVPPKTRDGREWQSNGKASPYAKLIVNGRELFRTGVQADTLEPTWPDGPRGNFKIGRDEKVRVELWDSNPINDKPIGARELGAAGDLQPFESQLRVDFENGAEVVLGLDAAHALSGLGLWYELRSQAVGITRLLAGSPAERAGIQANDEVLKIGPREVKSMTPDEVKSAFNAVPLDGLTITVKHPAGAITDVLVKEGPIYPLYSEFGNVD